MCPLIIDFNKIELCYNTNAHDIYIYIYILKYGRTFCSKRSSCSYSWMIFNVGRWVLNLSIPCNSTWKGEVLRYNDFNIQYVQCIACINLKPLLTIIHNWFDIYFFKAIFIYDLEIKITFGYPMHRIFTSL